MAEVQSVVGLTSHKGRKLRNYTVEFKLDVVNYAEENNSNQAAAIKFQVDRHSVRDWRKKKSDLQSLISMRGNKKRVRLEGGGRKPLSEEMESLLLEYILDRRLRGLHVSRKLIMKKAMVIYQDIQEAELTEETFEASKGWLEKFMQRNSLSLRRHTSVAQKDPDLLVSKVVSYILRVRRLREKFSYQPADMIAFDETPIWADMISNTTVDVTGKKTITLKSTGHEKLRVTVGLAAKGDGTKLKPIIVFKGNIRQVQSLQKEFQSKCMIASTKNGWMDTNLTNAWTNSVLGQFHFRRRLLAWDTYECHLQPSVQASLKAKKIDTALIPGGCTKYIQAPDVCWNKPFKSICMEHYDKWLETEGIHNETASGNLRPPTCKVIIQWIIDAWQQLPVELIRNSFTSCGLTNALDGTEDDKIHCFKEGQPCKSGREMLSEQMKLMHETEEDPFIPSSSEVDAAKPLELLIDEDSEDNEDIDITG